MMTESGSDTSLDNGSNVTLRFKTRQFEHEDIQKKTFTKWINSKLMSRGYPAVLDLFEDLRDGTRLLILLEILTGTPLKPEIGRMRVHHLNNVNQVIELMEFHQTKLVNISSDHIVDGNPKMTLALVWSVIQRWQMENMLKSTVNGKEGMSESLERDLLEWCRQITRGYQNVDVMNFTNSWNDGLAFNALIHHFHPELFDYEMLVGRDNLSNLQHAFNVAYENLGIVRLLDPEDVNVPNPDKKSIMMYLMCCYQVLSLNSSGLLMEQPSLEESVPVNAASFQNAIETVLMWLLDAQDTLCNQTPVEQYVQAVKEQFQEHEEFMVNLTIQQSRIGQILQVGNQLLNDIGMTDDEARQIEAQMSLLNSHWEELRIRAMDRQTSLQQVLTSLQQQQLDRLSDWLSTMEAEISDFNKLPAGTGRKHLLQQQEKHKLLQEAVEKEQEFVSSLQNMVVVVDDSNSDEAYVALEKQLESLGLRWGCVCRLVEERAVILQNALKQWRNFDCLVSEFSDWLSRSEQIVFRIPLVNSSTKTETIVEEIRMLKHKTTCDGLCIDIVYPICIRPEQIKLSCPPFSQAASLESEIDEWVLRYDAIQLQGKHLVLTADQENAMQVDEQIQQICTRWDSLVQRMEQRSCEIMESGIELNVAKTEEESQILTVSRKHETQIVTEVVALGITESLESKRPRLEVIENSVDSQQHATGMSEADSFDGAMDKFNEWIESIEQRLSTEKVVVDEQDVMEKQLEQFVLLQEEVNSHLNSFSHLDKTSLEKIQQGPSSTDVGKLRSDLEKLRWRWTSVTDSVAILISQCHSTIEQVIQFKAQTGIIKQWITDMEEFIRPFTEPFSSLDVLKDQLNETESVNEDVKTMETTLASVNSTSLALMELAEAGPFKEKTRLQTDESNSLFKDIVKRIGAHNEQLKGTLEQAQHIVEKIRQFDVWIDDVTATHLKRGVAAESKDELVQLENDLKNLLEQISSNQNLFRQINDDVSSLANGPIMMAECEDLNKDLTQLNVKWSKLQSQAKDANKKVQQLNENYTVFSGLLRDELRWLDQLERKLSAGPRPSGDAEELSEELDELENFVHSQKDGNRTKLNELAQMMIGSGVLSSVLTEQLAKYQKRNEALTSQAKQMMIHLEDSIIQAQNRESRILDMSQWMAEMADLLQSRLDADILAGDVPKEYETLQSEFMQQENLLRELETDAAMFHEQKKLEAAERLEQQIALLKRHFTDVSAKFSKFQRPADFDTKLTHVKRVLDDIEQRLHLVDLTCSDPESVQNKFDQCMKFYRTMSEIKSDVEYVIKTGRQIVEKKQVDFPGTLTSQINAVKQHYNNLGSQVTASKSVLEKASKISQNFTSELAKIQTYADSLRIELSLKEAAKTIKNITEELQWSELMLAKIDEKQQMVTGLDDHLVQFAKLSEDISLTESEQELQHISEQLSELADRLRSWQARLEELSSHLEQVYGDFNRYHNEIAEWITHAESDLAKHTSSHAIDDNSLTLSHLQQLQSERSQHAAKVDKVRDLAVELISSSKKHERLVEPLFTAFNQRWVDFEETLKTAINCNTQAETSTAEGKIVRATAALTQLLAEETDIVNGSSNGLLEHNFRNSLSDTVIDENVSRNLMEMKEDERNLRMAVDSAKERKTTATTNSHTSQELLNLQSELAAYQSRLYELQRHSMMLSGEDESAASDVRTTIVALESKIAEIKLCLANLNASRSVVSSSTSAVTTTSITVAEEDSTVDENSIELQIVSPVESAPVFRYEKPSDSSSLTVTTVSTTSVTVSSLKSSSVAEESISVNTAAPLAAGPAAAAAVDMVSMPKLDNFIAKLDKFAVVLSDKSKSHSVVIGNIDEIDIAAQTKKTVEKDLRMMKPQIDAIVTKCEALKSESTSDLYTRMLNENVNRLYQCWQTAISTVADRHQTLDQMLASSRQYAIMYAETEEWILETTERYRRDDIGTDIATLKQQIDILESERMELNDSQQRVDMVIAIAQKLIDDYKTDDPSKILSDIKRITERWQALLAGLSEREKSLQIAINAMYRFDTDLKNCLLWLTKVEVVLNHHSEMTVDSNRMDEGQLNQIRQAVRDLQSEMDSQQLVLDSLNRTAQQLTGDVERASNVRSQLDEMNRRSSRLSSRASEIKNRLDMTGRTDPSEEVVKKLAELVQWVAAKSDLLNRQRPIAGDIETIQRQLDIAQSMQHELDSRQPNVEECIRKVRLFVQENKDTVARESIVKLEQHVKVLDDRWNDVGKNAQGLQNDLDETLEKLVLLQDALEDLSQRLVTLENETRKWKPIADIILDDLQHQIDSTLTFQQKVAPTQSEVDHCNDLANQFTDVVLSHKNVGRLEDLNKRWSALHTSVEIRLKQLRDAYHEFGPQSQQLLAVSVSRPWERAVTSNHVPYYIDHQNECTHWDHPELVKITQSLVGFNNVRFSAYRTAMKLHQLQKKLNLDLVELESVNKVLDSLLTTKSGEVVMVSVPDIVNCLVTLYEPLAIHAPSSRSVNIPLSVDLVLNWLLNVYDSGRSGQIRALSFKVIMVLMCNAHYEDKYKSIFRLAANSKHKIDRHGMTLLLRDCIQIPKQLGEVAAFGGSNVEPSVQSCFEKGGSQPELSADQFVDWMKMEPQSMVWIPVMHRVSAAENSRHHARCSVCKVSPIVGLRYRCLKCFSFDMCQSCFFSGQTAKSHKLTHPMQEYCGTTTSSEDMRDFTKVFKNRFRSKQYFKKHPRLGYLPVSTGVEGVILERSVSEDSSLRYTTDAGVSTNTASSSSTPKEKRNATAVVPQSVSPPGHSEKNISTLEMHTRVSMQAQRLAAVEKKLQKRNAVPLDVEDEHNLILQYCENLQGHKADTLKSPMQILAGVHADQQTEMESVIRELETENRELQAEYDQLLLTHRDPSVHHPSPSRYNHINGVELLAATNGNDTPDDRDAELLAEAKQLAKHKTELEVRMRLLEEHNRQLESQLQRLHLLLDQPEADGAHVVTFSSSEKPGYNISAASSHSSLPRRDPPTFAAYQQSVRAAEKVIPVQNGGYSANEQRLLSEEEELEKIMKELQETLPNSDGTNNVENLFQTVGQVSKAVGTLVNIMTVDNEEPVAVSTRVRLQ